jgi:hypothetical protein
MGQAGPDGSLLARRRWLNKRRTAAANAGRAVTLVEVNGDVQKAAQ